MRARRRDRMKSARGSLPERSCERCGSPSAEIHHITYVKPSKIAWLCSRCHGSLHYPEATARAKTLEATSVDTEMKLRALAEKYKNR